MSEVNLKSNGLVSWLVVAMIGIGALVFATVDDGGHETDVERIQRLADSFACPRCNGESVAESSAAVSVTIRQYIADQVASGASDDEIRDELVLRYGDSVLLNAQSDGLSSLLWILPVLIVGVGSFGVAQAIRRQRSLADVELSSEDIELVERARERLG